MLGYEDLLNSFIIMIVTIDPIGLAPFFLTLTTGMSSSQRNQVSLRASVISFFVLMVFFLGGIKILSAVGIVLPSFRIAGGILLFTISFEMLFEKRAERREKNATRVITQDVVRDLAVFPLAVPLIAGPGSISAVMLLSSGHSSYLDMLFSAIIIVFVLLLTHFTLVISKRVDRVLGESGRSMLTRLLGLLLAALAVQYIIDGIKQVFGI